MELVIQTAVTVICAVLASSGFWAYIQKKHSAKDVKTKLLLGLAYDRLVQTCQVYLKQGYITHNQYEDLRKYLYDPYIEAGGNGTAKHLMEQVNRLEIKPDCEEMVFQ